jgi:hypothetical protein
MILDVTKDKDLDIASAMRGPDAHTSSHYCLKMLTTAVVRYFAGVQHGSVYVTVNTPREAKHFFEKLTDREREEVRYRWLENSHFRRHVLMALGAFEDRGIGSAGWYTTWLYAALGGKSL